MLKQCKKFICASLPLRQQVATSTNYVTSDFLEQVQRHCRTCCVVPKPPKQKVTIIGAGSDIGRIVSLLLKQQTIIKKLAMYDENPDNNVLGVATDIGHMDTSVSLKAYQGQQYLKKALTNADVVVICGGYYMQPPECRSIDYEVFLQNMHLVRSTALACAHCCPKCILAIQTPPVDCHFALAMHTLKETGVYSKRRLLGVNAISAMRANQLFCSITGLDPTYHVIPVVCGTGRCTGVPVFSAGKASNFPQTQAKCLTRLVREADEIICKVKANREQGHLSIGFATARFVLSIMKGLFNEGDGFIDSALVEQDDPEKCYKMNVCATPVVIGSDGIVEYRVPTLNETETRLLEESKCHLEDHLNLGRAYTLGEPYCSLACNKCLPLHKYPICPCFPTPCQGSIEKLKGIQRH